MSNVEAVWAIGNYEGEQAKDALALADAGVAYIVLERGGTKTKPACLVAFRVAMAGKPLPVHLQEVKDPYKIAEHEKTRKSRQGLVDRDLEDVASSKTIAKVRKLFEQGTSQ